MDELVKEIKSRGVLRSENIEKALRATDRRDFVPEDMKKYAYLDEALPIGSGQTISQPYTVVFMLELLRVSAGQEVFDIGCGSGWQTALLAHIVGKNGSVCAVELVPELCTFGEKNVAKYPELFRKVKFFCQNAESGLPREAAAFGGFDRIIAAAEVEKIPGSWREELKDGGIMVYPSGGSLFRETREGGEFRKEEFPGFEFVPFIYG